MKPKTMILMVVAVGCGLVASYMTSQLLADRGNQTTEEPQEKVKILVAKKDIAMGQLIVDPREYFKEKVFLKGEEPQKALTENDYGKLKDRRVVKPVRTDEFITLADLVDKNQNTMMSRVPPGMRAVGIKVNVEQIAGGFASLPLSKVDIVSTLRRGDGDSISQILLEDILVLAADSMLDRPTDKGAIAANTVTVALTPEEAELITLAQEMGTLRLILRGYGDSKKSSTDGVSGNAIVKGGFRNKGKKPNKAVAELLKGWPKIKEKEQPKKSEPVKIEPPKPKYKVHVLTIYHGDQARKYVYKLDDKGNVIHDDIAVDDPEPKSTEPTSPPKKPEVKKPEPPKAPPVDDKSSRRRRVSK